MMGKYYSDLREGDRIAFLNESNDEHPFVDQGEIIDSYGPGMNDYGEMIPLRHLVEPESDAMPYVVQNRDILDVL